MRCLVTGGLGFIGSHLVKALRNAGHKVAIQDDFSNPVWSPDEEYCCVPVEKAVLYRACDWIFHLAAVSRTQDALGDPLRCNAVNVGGSLNVMELARRCNARLVLASSNIVYGSPNPYKASKLAMEEYAEAYRHCYGLNVVVLRYSNVYGPGMRWDDSLCLAAMRRSAVERAYVELTGNGHQSRHFTHVSDIVKGTIAACESDYTGRPVDLCSNERIELSQAAGYFGVPVRWAPARVGDSEILHQNPLPAKNIFGWSAHIPFSNGIKDVLAEAKPTEVAA